MSASLLQYRSTVCFHCADNIITIIVLPLLAIFLHTWLFLRQRIYLSAAALCPMLLAVVQWGLENEDYLIASSSIVYCSWLALRRDSACDKHHSKIWQLNSNFIDKN